MNSYQQWHGQNVSSIIYRTTCFHFSTEKPYMIMYFRSLKKISGYDKYVLILRGELVNRNISWVIFQIWFHHHTKILIENIKKSLWFTLCSRCLVNFLPATCQVATCDISSPGGCNEKTPRFKKKKCFLNHIILQADRRKVNCHFALRLATTSTCEASTWAMRPCVSVMETE